MAALVLDPLPSAAVTSAKLVPKIPLTAAAKLSNAVSPTCAHHNPSQCSFRISGMQIWHAGLRRHPWYIVHDSAAARRKYYCAKRWHSSACKLRRQLRMYMCAISGCRSIWLLCVLRQKFMAIPNIRIIIIHCGARGCAALTFEPTA